LTFLIELRSISFFKKFELIFTEIATPHQNLQFSPFTMNDEGMMK